MRTVYYLQFGFGFEKAQNCFTIHANSKKLGNFVSYQILHILFDLASISIEHCKKSFFNQTIWENQFCGRVLLLSIRYLAIKIGTVTGIAIFFQKLRCLLSFWSQGHLNLFWLSSAPLYDSAMEVFAFHSLILSQPKDSKTVKNQSCNVIG